MAAAVPARAIGVRVATALLGSYVFVWGFVSAVIVALTAAGLTLVDARSVGNMTGLLAYLAAFIWAFGARNITRVWIVLGVCGIILSLIAWAAARAMTSG